MNPQTTLIVAFAYKKPVPQETAAWFQRRGFTKVLKLNERYYPLIAARNFGCRQGIVVAEKEGCDRVIFLDNDVAPIDNLTDEWLALPGDVTACRCETGNGATAWAQPHSFHWALSSASVEALKRIPPPWCLPVYNDDGTRLLKCDCMYFAEKAKAAGLTVVHGGFCVHHHERSWTERAY